MLLTCKDYHSLYKSILTLFKPAKNLLESVPNFEADFSFFDSALGYYLEKSSVGNTLLKVWFPYKECSTT